MKQREVNVEQATKLDTEGGLPAISKQDQKSDKRVAYTQQSEYRMAQLELKKDMENRAKEASQVFGGVYTPEDARNASPMSL